MKGHYPIEVLCKALCVSRSGYYQWVERRNKPSARVREDLDLAEQIREVHRQSGSTYGTPRLEAELRVSHPDLAWSDELQSLKAKADAAIKALTP